MHILKLMSENNANGLLYTNSLHALLIGQDNTPKKESSLCSLQKRAIQDSATTFGKVTDTLSAIALKW